jgi:hypothetical protein
MERVGMKGSRLAVLDNGRDLITAFYESKRIM